ncbi:MAG TPA: LUD domain-containing protein [Pirellulales bacterium]|jgi:L-lactate dehydrogenase complex protein LldG|nr:LUD domain-containing protein [Pirellulales bacterium]
MASKSKDDILAAVRRQRVPETPLPSLDGPWIAYPDRAAQFAAMLEFVGGCCVRVEGVEQLNAQLAELPVWNDAKKTVSLVEGVGRSTFDLAAVADPHELEDVDFAILPGQFGVAENGAVWIDDRNLRHRVLPFIVQHLALVVRAGELIDTMHAAYERLRFDGPGFGVFISGPSKTADIEQSLVIGAHGPRSLTVFLMV